MVERETCVAPPSALSLMVTIVCSSYVPKGKNKERNTDVVEIPVPFEENLWRGREFEE